MHLPHKAVSLDALHLATVLTFGQELRTFVTHDRRLAESATEVGLPVLTP